MDFIIYPTIKLKITNNEKYKLEQKVIWPVS